jgi:hypothetical protein
MTVTPVREEMSRIPTADLLFWQKQINYFSQFFTQSTVYYLHFDRNQLHLPPFLFIFHNHNAIRQSYLSFPVDTAS